MWNRPVNHSRTDSSRFTPIPFRGTLVRENLQSKTSTIKVVVRRLQNVRRQTREVAISTRNSTEFHTTSRYHLVTRFPFVTFKTPVFVNVSFCWQNKKIVLCKFEKFASVTIYIIIYVYFFMKRFSLCLSILKERTFAAQCNLYSVCAPFIILLQCFSYLTHFI